MPAPIISSSCRRQRASTVLQQGIPERFACPLSPSSSARVGHPSGRRRRLPRSRGRRNVGGYARAFTRRLRKSRTQRFVRLPRVRLTSGSEVTAYARNLTRSAEFRAFSESSCTTQGAEYPRLAAPPWRETRLRPGVSDPCGTSWAWSRKPLSETSSALGAELMIGAGIAHRRDGDEAEPASPTERVLLAGRPKLGVGMSVTSAAPDAISLRHPPARPGSPCWPRVAPVRGPEGRRSASLQRCDSALQLG